MISPSNFYNFCYVVLSLLTFYTVLKGYGNTWPLCNSREKKSVFLKGTCDVENGELFLFTFLNGACWGPALLLATQ